jgi:hypothetical protein
MKHPRRSTTFLIKIKRHKMKVLVKAYTISISGSVISLKVSLYYYLEQSTSFNLTIKISKQEKEKLFIICWYVEIHSTILLNQLYNLELHLVKKRHTYNWNRVLLKMIRSRWKKKVEDHHYRHHHCVYTYVYVSLDHLSLIDYTKYNMDTHLWFEHTQ